MYVRVLSSSVLLAAFSVGCGGHGSTAVPAAPSSSSQTVQVQFRITIPPAPAAKARRPAYVSAATQSASVIVTPGNTTTIINCDTTARTCSGSVLAPLGSDTFTVKLYDGQNATGNLLSSGAVAQTISIDQANSVNVTFNGIVSTLSVALNPSSVASGTSTSVGVTVNALDADGNVIVGPGSYADANGNPLTVTLSNSDTSGATHLSQTTLIAPTSGLMLSYNGASIPNPTISAAAPGLTTRQATLGITATGTLSAAQVNAALQSVATYYGTLSHGDNASDTQKVVQFIATQPAFQTAGAVPGGISALLSDGTPAFFYTDRFSDEIAPPVNVTFSKSSRSLSAQRGTQAAGGHSIVFLVNDDGDPAFVPALEKALATAFAAAYPSGQYNATSGSISLANLVALSSASVDVLGLATHGIADERVTPARYMWESTTPITDQNLATYSSLDYKKTLFPGQVLDPENPSGHAPTFAFTAGFVAEHVGFTPGAIVLNSSCFGQYVTTANGVTSTLFAAGVGAYFGWTKLVNGVDSDETDAFFVDRLLGEQAPTVTGLSGIITQRTPPQRPFSLTEIYAQMLGEKRNDPAIQKFRDPASPAGETLATSTDATDPDGAPSENWSIAPLSDGPTARWVLTTSDAINGFPIPSAGVIEFGGPSIAYMTVDETTTPATLTINGEFPATPGQVTMSSSSSSQAGGSAFTVTSWTQSAITAQLSDEGSTAAGYVTVTAQGVPSNPVPLTQWTGNLKVSETSQIGSGPFDPKSIGGSASVQETFTIHFRADVHSFYGSPDVGLPYPTNFAFTPEKDSTGTYGPVNGSAAFSYPVQPPAPAFSYNLTFGVGSPGTLMTQNPGGANFTLGSILSGNGPQYGCNGGGQGPSDAAQYSAISCIHVSVSVPNGFKISCSDSQSGNICTNEGVSPNPLLAGGGQTTDMYGVFDAIKFIMDYNYNVTAQTNIPSTDPLISNSFRGTTSTTTYTFSFGAPVAPPIQGTTPAGVARLRR